MRLSRPVLLTSLFYAAMFAALGAYLPFWPVWMEDWGLTTGEVGAYLAASLVARTLGGFLLPILADWLDQRRATLALLCAAAGIVFLAHVLIGTKSAFFGATLVSAGILAGLLPLGEALGGGAAQRHGFPYAPVRAVGSVAFLIVSVLLGWLILNFGVNSVLVLMVAALFVSAALALVHPGGGTLKGQKAPRLADIWRMMTLRRFLIFSAAAASAQASHAVLYAYGSVHWRALGLPETVIGALWSFAVVVEIVLLLGPGPWLVARLGPVVALAIGAVGGVLRWGILMTDPLGAWLWAAQALHAGSFAMSHLGAMAFILAAIPDRYAGTAQGAYSGLISGLAFALITGLAALVYPTYGGQTYLLALVASLVALGFTFWLSRVWSGEVVEPDAA